jgi:hypothetical protein
MTLHNWISTIGSRITLVGGLLALLVSCSTASTATIRLSDTSGIEIGEISAMLRNRGFSIYARPDLSSLPVALQARLYFRIETEPHLLVSLPKEAKPSDGIEIWFGKGGRKFGGGAAELYRVVVKDLIVRFGGARVRADTVTSHGEPLLVDMPSNQSIQSGRAAREQIMLANSTRPAADF